jgi:prepilin-type processing-associated H-X9-DG protein
MPRAVSGINQDEPPLVSQTVLLFEKGGNLPGAWEDATAENYKQSTSAASNPKEDPFHNGGKNFAFLDGHVKWWTKGAGPFAQVTRPGVEPGTCDTPGAAPAGDWPAN